MFSTQWNTFTGILLEPVEIRPRPIRAFLARLGRAWRLTRGRLTKEDSRQLFLLCWEELGLYPLYPLTLEDTIEEARDVFDPNPNLPHLIGQSVVTVGHRRNATENLAKARERAFELAEAYSQTEEAFIRFPLIRRGVSAPPPTANPTHVLYAPRRLTQSAAASAKTNIQTAPITGFDHAASRRDGWILADFGTYPDGKPHIEIQAYKALYFARSPFACDRDAWDHVVKQARAGSALHMQALDRIDERERLVIEASTRAL